MPSVADQLKASIVEGLSHQIEDSVRHQAALARRVRDHLEADPVVASLEATFARQQREFPPRAAAAEAAGDHRRAVELTEAAERAARNAARLETALEGGMMSDLSGEG